MRLTGGKKPETRQAQPDRAAHLLGATAADVQPAFDGQAALKGTRKALSAVASDDIRVYRPGKSPSVGKGALKTLIRADAGKSVKGPGQVQNSSARTGIAWSGDLAFSYGTASIVKKGAVTETTAYLRVWRRQAAGRWKIVLDVELPVPPGAIAEAKPGA